MVIVKMPSMARGEVTVRCATIGGGSIVRAACQLDLRAMTYDIEIALRPAKILGYLYVGVAHPADPTA